MTTNQIDNPAVSADQGFEGGALAPPGRRRWGLVKGVLIGLAGAVAAFAAVAAMQPADFRIERSAKMAAPASAAFAQVNDYHNWEAWSPWARLDPDAQNTFEGPASGIGATFRWSGNDKVGAGRQTIVESKPDQLIRIQLDFEKPFKDTCLAEFSFRPEGDETVVTWSMSGKRNFIAKAISLVIDCDKMVGPDFEKGLANLKAIVEAPAAAPDQVGAEGKESEQVSHGSKS
jgi:polyketide cyclase/dehydrase/lipid transport protein